MSFPLKEEREEDEGEINISSGSGTGDFEGLIWIEVGQGRQLPLSVDKGHMRYTSCVPGP